MFECVRGKTKEVIAFGGRCVMQCRTELMRRRYDSLLEHFKQPSQSIQSRKVYGVGMSIAVEWAYLFFRCAVQS
jgi:translation initiation factor 2-alpha kinase 4